MDIKKYLVLFIVLFPLTAFAYRHHHVAAPVAPIQVSLSANLQLGAYNLKTGTIQAYFDGWNDTPNCAPAGQSTLIFWENYGVSLDSIIAGDQDAAIKRFGNALCTNVVLAPFAEMDGNWNPWSGDPQKLILAWKRIHDLIGNKAKYVWTVNDSDVPDVSGNRPSDYWPGSLFVDYVAVDGFDWGGMTFMQAIAPNFDVIKSYGKPVWVTSFGTVSDNKTAWLTDAIAKAKANDISALIYFDSNDDADFMLNAQAVAAFH